MGLRLCWHQTAGNDAFASGWIDLPSCDQRFSAAFRRWATMSSYRSPSRFNRACTSGHTRASALSSNCGITPYSPYSRMASTRVLKSSSGRPFRKGNSSNYSMTPGFFRSLMIKPPCDAGQMPFLPLTPRGGIVARKRATEREIFCATADKVTGLWGNT